MGKPMAIIGAGNGGQAFCWVSFSAWQNSKNL